VTADVVVVGAGLAGLTAARVLTALQYDRPLPTARDGYTQRSPQGRLIEVEAIYPRPFWRDAGLTGAVASDTGPARSART
jgi:monoamine oxidase